MTVLLRLFGGAWLVFATVVIVGMYLAYSGNGQSGPSLLVVTIMVTPGILGFLAATAVDLHRRRQYERAMGLRTPVGADGA